MSTRPTFPNPNEFIPEPKRASDIPMPGRQTYSDLKQFGLEFVTPEGRQFSDLVKEITSLRLFDEFPDDPAAVLLNNSGKTIIAYSHIWKLTYKNGTVGGIPWCTLRSSEQIDILTGRNIVTKDVKGLIIPGSKRLFIEEGVIGKNDGVLAADKSNLPEQRPYLSSGRRLPNPEIVAVELVLDAVFFEDGLCAGPDEHGLFKLASEHIEWQVAKAHEIVLLLQKGEPLERVIEIFRRVTDQGASMGDYRAELFYNFAATAIRQAKSAQVSDLLAWFQGIAQPSSLRLRRA